MRRNVVLETLGADPIAFLKDDHSYGDLSQRHSLPVAMVTRQTTRSFKLLGSSDGLEYGHECGNFFDRRRPDDIVVHVEIRVDQAVPHRRHLMPRSLW